MWRPWKLCECQAVLPRCFLSYVLLLVEYLLFTYLWFIYLVTLVVCHLFLLEALIALFLLRGDDIGPFKLRDIVFFIS